VVSSVTLGAMASRARFAWSQCSADDRAIGASWYAMAHNDATDIADHYGIPVHVVCGALSVLSVGIRWSLTIDAVHILAGQLTGKSIPTYRTQIRKAQAMLAVEPDHGDMPRYISSTGKGYKTLSFYDNLAFPGDSMAVTLDRHMLRAMGIDESLGDRVSVYTEGSEAIRTIARREGLLPHQVQAAIWTMQRGE